MPIRAGVLAAWMAAFVLSMGGAAHARPLAVTVEPYDSKYCWASLTGSCGGVAESGDAGTSVAETFVTSAGSGTLAGAGTSLALSSFYGRFTLDKPAKSVTVTATTQVNSASAAWTAGAPGSDSGYGLGRVLLQSFLYDAPAGCSCPFGAGAEDVTVVSTSAPGPAQSVSDGEHALSFTIRPGSGVNQLPAGEYTTWVRNYALVDLGREGDEASGTLRATLDGVVTITAESKG